MPLPNVATERHRSFNALEAATKMCDSIPRSLLSLSFQSTSDAVRKTLECIAQAVADAGQNPTATNNIELAMAEALNNVVEHSFRDRENGQILLSIMLLEDSFRISIRHDGTPMPGLRLPAGKPATIGNEIANLPEGGFGWFLIRSLIIDATYSHRENWNELVLRFSRHPAN
ncbi:ATP-binding protein [Primorskyibacter flagellatus]|uniref:ATP-binding protein n=1 Tax=Primorskyibacter flagellatus TaxID=1387277 RepID=UPI003A8D8BC6